MTLSHTSIASSTSETVRPVGLSLKRGFLGRCPNCGEGALYRGYLKVNDHCPVCNEAFFHQRADDAPPYVTLLIVCHVLIALYLLAEDYGPALSTGTLVAIFCALGMAMCLALLPGIKGALIALQWALRMHGFHGPESQNSGQKV